MVSCCVNPACRTEFRSLNTGVLYAAERGSADTEFFWLCSACVPRSHCASARRGAFRLDRDVTRYVSPLIRTANCGWLLSANYVHQGTVPASPGADALKRI